MRSIHACRGVLLRAAIPCNLVTHPVIRIVRPFTTTFAARARRDEYESEFDGNDAEPRPLNNETILQDFFPTARPREREEMEAFMRQIEAHNEASRAVDVERVAEEEGAEAIDSREDVVTYDPTPMKVYTKNPGFAKKPHMKFRFASSNPALATGYALADKLANEEMTRLMEDGEPIELLDGVNMHDDMTPLAHMKVNEHRVKRMYNRVAAWEMPNLRDVATEFVPRDVKAGEVFEFQYTTYMGQVHDAEAKVAVRFTAAAVAKAYFGEDIAIRAKRLHKLRLLCGTRYNPTTDMVVMSATNFPNAVQNKQFLVDSLTKLLTAAQDVATEEAAFADVPLDKRHVKSKKKIPGFPREWTRPQDVVDVQL
ncbi:mitochondrial 37S ribosomal protein mS35 [Limtongia smithiae]|uniref:mitochondrial 37S ribosomal protein mS35 n=1 Tax=Limtongia smithiae TaxID=1125753 RepID=UPI0034CD3E9D